MLLTDVMKENMERFGEYPFLHYGEKTYTNFETAIHAKQIASALKNLGIQKGDRVLVCMPNCPEVIFSYQGILHAEAVVIPVMFLLHAQEIAFILENSRANAIITSAMLVPKLQEAVRSVATNPMILAVDAPSAENVQNLYDLMNQADASLISDRLNLDENDLAVILYTSGTTGKPKGVMLTHKNLYSNAASSASLNTDGRSTTLGVLPLAHVYGFTVTNVCFLLGNSVVIFSKFDPDAIFKAIETYKVKGFSAVPAMIHAMVTSPHADRYDLSSLEWVGSGSAPLPVALLEAFRQKFNAEVYEGYGLSEAAPTVTAHRKKGIVKPGSVGIPIPGVEIQIVDPHGRELPTGEVGELIVRGPNVTTGYFQNPDATESAIQNGWLHTGDMAKVDEDGYLYIVDRKKDLIIRGGFNIYPRDLEELLVSHEAVSEAAVIGVASERLGEEVIAYVVKQAGKEVTEQELIQFCQDRLAKYKTPRRILFIDQLPRNGVGKILKQRLRDMSSEVELIL
ncbi:class I adenylate-forming enzyme family protein [Effusibacillus dendaii]|uniref:Long-chain-fatty-acid--CoA ligase n=1 Tax=Effusibacillus dendaii TaxID=2743772 RepID=A0A7I8D667_9BACL|nr:long-chain fatty acid--CoA ligase [Effusibacillus dendaii]BCJ85487.1 long-chain-fatty-acid--CoA ligase [Effusibacillus dendaii]